MLTETTPFSLVCAKATPPPGATLKRDEKHPTTKQLLLRSSAASYSHSPFKNSVPRDGRISDVARFSASGLRGATPTSERLLVIT